MKEVGRMIYKMGMELRLGLMLPDMRDIIKLGRKRDLGFIIGMMVLNILGSGLTTKFKVLVFTPGLTGE